MIGSDVWHSEAMGLLGEAGEVAVTRYWSCMGRRQCRGSQWMIVSLEEILGAGETDKLVLKYQCGMPIEKEHRLYRHYYHLAASRTNEQCLDMKSIRRYYCNRVKQGASQLSVLKTHISSRDHIHYLPHLAPVEIASFFERCSRHEA